MIQVVYCPEECSVRITGHAGSGPKGQDLICAAVSALVLTLDENVKHMARSQWFTAYTAELTEGSAYIRCQPKPEAWASVRGVFDGICRGLKLLATLWPEYICWQIAGDQ